MRDVSFEWRPGERLLLLGPSGGGKSTLALCLNGTIPHSLEAHWEAGRVLVDGHDTRRLPLGELSRRVAVLFQDPEAQLVMLEVDDEIAFGMENHGVPRAEMRARVEGAKRLVGLDPLRTPARLDHLSGGTKQRVALASLLALAPEALVLDEPTANLDPAGAREVLGTVASLAAERERSLLLVEHRLDAVLPLVDRVIVLDDRGAVALEGDPDRVFLDHATQLDRLGVWTPDLARLTRRLDPHSKRVPRSPAEAAHQLVTHWARDQSPGGAASHPPPARAAGPPRLLVEDLHYRYPRGGIAAVAGISLTLAAGELVAVVGGNAAGKSTLGLLMAGALTPDRGTIALDGVPLSHVPASELRRRLAYVFQYPEHQFVAHTVRHEMLAGMARRSSRTAEAERRAAALLDRFGLAHLREASPFMLSHGQKRRLSVATALMSDPDLLILDEPTFGQDRRHTTGLMALLDELRSQGRTVVVITHDMSLVAQHADRAIAVARGRVAFDGTPRALFGRDDALSQCGLERPPVAEAFRLAHRTRPDIPDLIALPPGAVPSDG
ncbi:MAG TPA: ATP-binding cassette domain-containing protein [Chloroflexota bacterium]|nr:ATP-binding cassette domain-containing protein [Chloroflexota bacterium]